MAASAESREESTSFRIEGIRAKDILPLLIQDLSFDLFIPFGNIVDTFIDHGFSHNCNAAAEWDRSFIDRVHTLDGAEMRNAPIKPIHSVAGMAVGRERRELCLEGMTPQFCTQRPSET